MSEFRELGIFQREQLSPAVAAGEWLVLTLIQPWASLVVLGEKQIETRGWRTHYRGRLHIHASRTMSTADRDRAKGSWFAPALRAWRSNVEASEWALGHIIGSVDLIDCLPVSQVEQGLSRKERAFGDYSGKRYGWRLANAELLATPIRAKGALGLWKFQPENAKGPCLNQQS